MSRKAARALPGTTPLSNDHPPVPPFVNAYLGNIPGHGAKFMLPASPLSEERGAAGEEERSFSCHKISLEGRREELVAC